MEKLGFTDEWSPYVYSGAGQESLQSSDSEGCPWGCKVELMWQQMSSPGPSNTHAWLTLNRKGMQVSCP